MILPVFIILSVVETKARHIMASEAAGPYIGVAVPSQARGCRRVRGVYRCFVPARDKLGNS